FRGPGNSITDAAREILCERGYAYDASPYPTFVMPLMRWWYFRHTVLTAEQNLYQAQNSLALAVGSVPLGLITVYRALGGGWQIRQGHDFVPTNTRNEMAERTNWGTWLTPQLLQPQGPGLPSPVDVGPLVRPPEW
ncbi:MAG: hypothetical protein HY268_15000, partial [Deltaproteobacteria bacterium]|nr:hypothetical protein [Deltaproteobacteria bacterium]